jgi:uncharacterized protein (TIGR00369 family)
MEKEEKELTDLTMLEQLFCCAIRFNHYMGMRVGRLERGFAELILPFREDFIGDPSRPALHGGVISALADTAGGLACFTMIGPTDRVSTVDLRVDFLRPGPPKEIRAEARVIRQGNHVGVADISVYATGEDELLAAAKGVYNVRRGDGK